MRYYREAGGKVDSSKKASRWIATERSRAIDYSGTWRSARHRGYGGDRVLYAKAAGATATFEFTGRKVAWNGPTGPTRGKAKVYIDGKYVKTVNAYRRSFDARSTLFQASWKAAGEHLLTIVVLGTKGHSMVAIDDFVVTK
jgi:hypothetical protein